MRAVIGLGMCCLVLTGCSLTGASGGVLNDAANSCASNDSAVTTADHDKQLEVMVVPGTPEASAECLIATLQAPDTTAALLRGSIVQPSGQLAAWASNPDLSTSWTTSGGVVTVTITLAPH